MFCAEGFHVKPQSTIDNCQSVGSAFIVHRPSDSTAMAIRIDVGDALHRIASRKLKSKMLAI